MKVPQWFYNIFWWFMEHVFPDSFAKLRKKKG